MKHLAICVISLALAAGAAAAQAAGGPDPPPQAVALHHHAKVVASYETVPFQIADGRWFVCVYPLHGQRRCHRVPAPRRGGLSWADRLGL